MLSSSGVAEYAPMPMQQAHPQTVAGAAALAQSRTNSSVLSRSLPVFATHKQLLGFSHSSGSARSSSTGSEGSSEGAGTNRLSLQDALNKIVDVAVEKVEADDIAGAVEVLQDGINTFEPVFPHSAEVGELHNQAALLLLFTDRAEDAAGHAAASLAITQRHFGDSSVLTGHRLLRLGACRFSQMHTAEAAGMLAQALDLLATDPSRFEAGFYLDLIALSHTVDGHSVKDLEEALLRNVAGLKESFGRDSMIMQLVMSQHARLMHAALDREFAVGEAILKQHIRLLEELDPLGEELGVACYKLSAYLYAHDMLPEAGSAVRRASDIMRHHYSDEGSDMVVLCKHRLGMICAAVGDHKSALQLLQVSHQHYSNQQAGGMLAVEAEIGLNLARFRAIPAGDADRAQQQQALLTTLRRQLDALSDAIGAGHMLVTGATRYFTQLTLLMA
ncbi:MAG: hypothetical protein WDW38_000100 [Sanguina aurantia]